MQYSKRFLTRFVKAMFLFNSCLVPGCIFTCQNPVSAHNLTAKEIFSNIMNQINLNGGYTGTGMPFGFSNGEECVYIPCVNGVNVIVPKQITEFISSEFNMYFHNLVLKYSQKSKSSTTIPEPPTMAPAPAPMPYPLPPSTMSPIPASTSYPAPSTMASAPAPMPYPLPPSTMSPIPASTSYPAPSTMAPTPAPYPTPMSNMNQVPPLSYIPPSTDLLG